MTPSTPSTPRFDLIGLVVSDMAASLAFYRLLGLEFAEGAESAPHVEAALPGGLRFALDTEDTIRSFHPGWQPPAGGGRVALAFLCDSPADVDTMYEAVLAAGHTAELKPFDAPWGMRYAVVHDPDGNAIDLFAHLNP
ncbi:VOC family protein [Streptomyces sp. NPDC102365]|uniref:VOC family protein n=1 Tax=Streptomyces sp. NPDC102365 TaxID=3366162 RepID=UPI00381CC635